MYQLLEDGKPRIMEVTVTPDGRNSYDASIAELVCSFLHCIVARPKILPYTDMVKWIVDSIGISNRQFKTPSQEVMGSFTAENLRCMYHLLETQASYNKQFIAKFAMENEDMEEFTKN